jgi:MFS family permease
LVREKRRAPSQIKLWMTVKALPESFRRFLSGVGIFGLGDFARTLMILAATRLLTPKRGLDDAAEVAGLLYVGHNVFYAACSYPVGSLSDRIGRRGLLSLGYMAGALVSLGFFAAFSWRLDAIIYLLVLFALSGFSIAVVDALEGAATADLITNAVQGTAYGVLGTVNGFGDLVASTVVGTLWTAVSPVVAFGYAAVVMGIGAVVMNRLR